MRHALLAMMAWTAACGLAAGQGMYTPVVNEPVAQAPLHQEDYTTWQNEPGWYLHFRNGIVEQHRSRPFQFGAFATSATAGDGLFVEALEFDLSESSYFPEIVVGRDLGQWAALEGRFACASFSIVEDFRLANPDGPGVSLFVPFLDGRAAPVVGGVAGIGIQQGGVVFSYDSDWYDFGAEYVVRLADNRCGRCEFLIGPAIANISQRYAHNVSGFADADFDQLRVSVLREEVDEWFYGVRMGARGWYGVHRCIDLEGAFDVYLLGQNAELKASQHLVAEDTAGTDAFDPINIAVDESRGGFVPRLEFQIGCRFRFSDCLAATLAYRFGAWFGVATVDNPDLTLGVAPDAWAGQPPVRMETEDLLTHALLLGLSWER